MISRWLDGREPPPARPPGTATPRDRLRVLREAAAASGPADSAMRRWAAAPARAPAGQAGKRSRRELAAAIARADAVTSGLLADALADLGLSGRESAAAAATLTAAFAAWPLAPAATRQYSRTCWPCCAGPPPGRRARGPGDRTGTADEVLLVLAAR